MTFNLAVIVYAVQQRSGWLLTYAKVIDHEIRWRNNYCQWTGNDGVILWNSIV